MSEVVGKLNELESAEIQELNEKRLSLENLEKIIDVSLKDKWQKDYAIVMEKFNSWWDITSNKYRWKKVDDKSWYIDFSTNEVILE